MRRINFITALILMIMAGSCTALFNSGHDLFRISDIYYQSWMLKDIEKGTDVIIELKGVDDDVEFTSLVFRGIEVDVNATKAGGKTTVKGVINTGPSLIENYEYEVTGADDVLKYKYRGKEFAYPLKKIRRQKTRFIQ